MQYIRVTISWGSFIEYVSDNNVASQGWTITQSFTNSVTLENTTDMIDEANFDIKDLCVNIISIAQGTSSVGANISRKFGVSSMVGNAQTANDNVQAGYQVLPVELTYFRGKSNACTSHLEWRTESEDRNAYFEVQHSLDGKTFEPRVKIQGAGTTVMPKVYEFMDTKAVEGINYYRLKQVDEDGYYEYFSVIAIDNHCGKERVFEIYPSPIGADQKLQVNFYTDKLETALIINDINGNSIKRYRQGFNQKGQHKVEVDVSDLPAGIYFVIDEYGNQQKFVKADY
ncbi:MAG: T9SS type A sorting domain-containing protein [Bacteroidota bacterium]